MGCQYRAPGGSFVKILCGICGKITRGNVAISRKIIKRMTAALRHRGPDDEGMYLNNASDVHVGLGHRRLRIIDLSERGRQPIWNEDHTICMVFNGEIYNHQDLRSKLEFRGHRFFSNTDCEAVVHLYEEQGYRWVQRPRRHVRLCHLGRKKVTSGPLQGSCRHKAASLLCGFIFPDFCIRDKKHSSGS